MTVNPSGFCQPDAIFAKNLFGATPADAVRLVAAWMSALSLRATLMPSVSPHELLVTSRYASSSERGSTSGVTLRKMSKTCCDTVLYFAKSGGTMMSDGHRRTALDIGSADRTPKTRAS